MAFLRLLKRIDFQKKFFRIKMKFTAEVKLKKFSLQHQIIKFATSGPKRQDFNK